MGRGVALMSRSELFYRSLTKAPRRKEEPQKHPTRSAFWPKRSSLPIRCSTTMGAVPTSLRKPTPPCPPPPLCPPVSISILSSSVPLCLCGEYSSRQLPRSTIPSGACSDQGRSQRNPQPPQTAAPTWLIAVRAAESKKATDIEGAGPHRHHRVRRLFRHLHRRQPAADPGHRRRSRTAD